MNNIQFSFLLTSLAGLATLIGALSIFLKGNKNKIIARSLFFAAGVMITVSLSDLIPEAYKILSNVYIVKIAIIYILIFIIIGFIFSMGIEKCVTSDNSLYRVGIFSMIAIILHNIPEGIVTFVTTNNNMSLGITLSIAIALHNIPEGISIAIPVYYATKSRFKAIMYTFLSGLSEFCGAIIAYIWLSNIINDKILAFLFSFIAGIMLYISIYELIPTANNYDVKRKCLFILLGVIVMIINIILFN